MDTSRIAVRTYEKGVEAETLSCGTGAVAAVAVMTLLDEIEPPVMVHTRSGETFSVNFTRNGSVIRGVTLEGGAHIVYDGEFLEENVD
jgi:diaminopimelate epimerase